MRINVYAEELPLERCVERVTKVADNGRTFFGARLYLQSADALHDSPNDDDRSAITFWGPREVVGDMLRVLAEEIDPRWVVRKAKWHGRH